MVVILKENEIKKIVNLLNQIPISSSWIVDEVVGTLNNNIVKETKK